jgi:Protein of unknown function (DUF3179)
MLAKANIAEPAMRFPLLFLGFFLAFASPLMAEDLTVQQIGDLTRTVLFGSEDQMIDALQKLEARKNRDIISSLIVSARYRGDQRIFQSLSKLTGRELNNWNDSMLWQEVHPEIKPNASFEAFKLDVFNRIDPAFMRFLGKGRADPDSLRIRLEEIVWGGVQVDGIPSLDNPKLIKAGEADYLKDSDPVFGVSINGDARAYPLRIMGWHEMFNETIGGVPVALAYCTLCGAGILFETKVEGRGKPLTFGSSGFLYRSNKLMFDRETDSLWNQFTGEPVSGPLAKSGIRLKIRPVTIAPWKSWRAAHPDTKVLSLDTGFKRDYGSGVVYADYFASPELMFPAFVRDESKVRRKDYVFGIRELDVARAWPLAVFEKQKIINDSFAKRPVVLIGDAGARTVRAYERGGNTFSASKDETSLKSGNAAWKVTEDALIGPDGGKLDRIAGHLAFWFAWDGYLGERSTTYGGKL